MKVLTASEGKVFAYKDDKGEEIILGTEIYLGKEDDGARYYEIDAPQQEIEVEPSEVELDA